MQNLWRLGGGGSPIDRPHGGHGRIAPPWIRRWKIMKMMGVASSAGDEDKLLSDDRNH